ncbi:hypothetical protein ACWDTN_25825, partial [Streptomyces sp. NPDC003483]
MFPPDGPDLTSRPVEPAAGPSARPVGRPAAPPIRSMISRVLALSLTRSDAPWVIPPNAAPA